MVTKNRTKCVGGLQSSCAVCIDLQAVGALEFFGELYSLANGFGPFLRGVWAGFREREGSIFVTTSTLPSLQAYAELYALSPLHGSISPCHDSIDLTASSRIVHNFWEVYGLFFFHRKKTSHDLPTNDAGNPVKFMENPYTRTNP